jgi:hypothetical protein
MLRRICVSEQKQWEEAQERMAQQSLRSSVEEELDLWMDGEKNFSLSISLSALPTFFFRSQQGNREKKKKNTFLRKNGVVNSFYFNFLHFKTADDENSQRLDDSRYQASIGDVGYGYDMDDDDNNNNNDMPIPAEMEDEALLLQGLQGFGVTHDSDMLDDDNDDGDDDDDAALAKFSVLPPTLPAPHMPAGARNRCGANSALSLPSSSAAAAYLSTTPSFSSDDDDFYHRAYQALVSPHHAASAAADATATAAEKGEGAAVQPQQQPQQPQLQQQQQADDDTTMMDTSAE